MTFHRLSAPSYIGGLPGGYDYVNDPAANGQAGVPAPADTSFLTDVNSPNEGTYFVGFGEDGRAFAPNRGFRALAENTDALDDFTHANVAVLTSTDFSASAAAVLVGTSTVPILVGVAGTSNTQAGLEPYFHVTDQNNDDIVDLASNNQVVVTAASAGVGTYFAGTLTLTLNIVPAVPYRVWYGSRSSLKEMKSDSFIRSSVWGIQHRQAGLLKFINDLKNATDSAKGAALVGLNPTGFSGGTLTAVTGSGIAPGTTVRSALLSADTKLIARRAFMAVLTDSTASTGGDFDSANIDTILAGTLGSGTYFVRPGSYSVANGSPDSVTSILDLVGDAAGETITLAAGRADDLTLTGGADLENISLKSLATSFARFAASPKRTATHTSGFALRKGRYTAGSLISSGGTGGYFIIEDSGTDTTTGIGSASSGIDLAGESRVSVRRSVFAVANNVDNFSLHDFDDDTASSIIIEDSLFLGQDVNVDAIRLLNVQVPVTFRNCVFEVSQSTGSGYAVRLLNNNSSVSFDNCIFRSNNGQVFWSSGSVVHLTDCRFESSNDFATRGAAHDQMVMINGGLTRPDMSTIRGCTISIGYTSIRGRSAAVQLPIIELGGTNNVVAPDSMIDVDGLYIEYATSELAQVHNFSTVVLHGGVSSTGTPGRFSRLYRNITFNVNSALPDDTGTLGGVYRPISPYPCYIEVGGGDTRHSTLVENLRIVDVGSPTVTHNRQIIFASRATMRNIIIDGSSIAEGTAFAQSLVELSECDVTYLSVMRQWAINCTGIGAVILKESTRWIGGEFFGRTSVLPSGGWIVYGDAFCEISGITGFWTTDASGSTIPAVLSAHEGSNLLGSRFFINTTWAADIVRFPAGADLSRIEGNLLFWKRSAAAEILLSAGFGSVVANNVMAGTGSAPTYTVLTSSIDSGNNAISDPTFSPVPV